jgi:hypothetical protein
LTLSVIRSKKYNTIRIAKKLKEDRGRSIKMN